MNKLHTAEELRELIELTVENLGLNAPFVVEKDFHITRAIHALAQVENDYFRLVFQGGTCLAKAYLLVQRMSEDCDFRMEAKPATNALSRVVARKELRTFRHDILQNLKEAGFAVEDDQIRTRNEGQFMNVRLEYEATYPQANGLKPYVKLEFFLNRVKTPTD